MEKKSQVKLEGVFYGGHLGGRFIYITHAYVIGHLFLETSTIEKLVCSKSLQPIHLKEKQKARKETSSKHQFSGCKLPSWEGTNISLGPKVCLKIFRTSRLGGIGFLVFPGNYVRCLVFVDIWNDLFLGLLRKPYNHGTHQLTGHFQWGKAMRFYPKQPNPTCGQIPDFGVPIGWRLSGDEFRVDRLFWLDQWRRLLASHGARTCRRRSPQPTPRRPREFQGPGG